jgi:hypothetical protein
MAQLWEDELHALQAEFHEIAVSVHRERYDRTLDEAILQRMTAPDMPLH